MKLDRTFEKLKIDLLVIPEIRNEKYMEYEPLIIKASEIKQLDVKVRVGKLGGVSNERDRGLPC